MCPAPQVSIYWPTTVYTFFSKFDLTCRALPGFHWPAGVLASWSTEGRRKVGNGLFAKSNVRVCISTDLDILYVI